MTGLVRPKLATLGMDLAGVIESVGEGVSAFAPGDRVFGMSPDTFGGHAEYLCLPEDAPIAILPAGLQFHEALVCEGAWYAGTYLEAFGVGPGHELLVYGASGAIGTAAVQLAKARGARVTAVVDTRHVELAASLGADRVVDYTAEDFTKDTTRYDFVFDAVGKTTYFRCRRLLTPNGVFSATDLGPWGQNLLLAWWAAITRSGRVVFPMPKSSRRVVEDLRDALATGQLRAVIDSRYPLEEIVEAYRYVETAQKTGIVVIDVVSAGDT